MKMLSGMAAIRALRAAEQVSKEAKRILTAFEEDPEIKHKATIKVTRILLLNSPYVMQGRSRDIRSKSLGAGVYELYTAEGHTP